MSRRDRAGRGTVPAPRRSSTAVSRRRGLRLELPRGDDGRRRALFAAARVPDPADAMRPLQATPRSTASRGWGPRRPSQVPAVRGDATTIARNLEALAEHAPDTVSAYIAMCRVALDLAVGRRDGCRGRPGGGRGGPIAGSAFGERAMDVIGPPPNSGPRPTAGGRPGTRSVLVPTMGAPPRRSIARLIQRARSERDRVVVSIFVNPLQFGPGEDLDTYPRDEAADLAASRALTGSTSCGHPRSRRSTHRGRPAGAGPRQSGRPSRARLRPGHFEGRVEGRASAVRPDGPERRLLRREGRPAALPRPSRWRPRRTGLAVTIVACPTVARGQRARAAPPGTPASRPRSASRRAACSSALTEAAEHARAGERDDPQVPGGVDGPRDRRAPRSPGFDYAAVVDRGDVRAGRHDRRAVARSWRLASPAPASDRQPAAPARSHGVSRAGCRRPRSPRRYPATRPSVAPEAGPVVNGGSGRAPRSRCRQHRDRPRGLRGRGAASDVAVSRPGPSRPPTSWRCSWRGSSSAVTSTSVGISTGMCAGERRPGPHRGVPRDGGRVSSPLRTPLIVGPRIKTGVSVADGQPAGGRRRPRDELASPRSHATAARRRRGLRRPARTSTSCPRTGEFVGGVIGPGIARSAAASLVSRTARLPRVELVAPPSIDRREHRRSASSRR